MQTIAIIGCGAIGQAVAGYLADHENIEIGVAVIEAGMDSRARAVFGEDIEIAYSFDDVSAPVNLAVDCAGHPALRQHGEAVLARGTNLVSVSSGALADAGLYDRLAAAAHRRIAVTRCVRCNRGAGCAGGKQYRRTDASNVSRPKTAARMAGLTR
jgi:aspartate dehydrogenase